MPLLLVAIVVLGLLAFAALWLVKMMATALVWVGLAVAVIFAGMLLGVVAFGVEGAIEQRRAKR